MSKPASVSQWIADLKEGEADAVHQLWKRYSRRLTDLARRRLANAPKRVADEDDIAQSVFFSICRAADEGRLESVKDRDDLWWMLLRLTRMKVTDHIRRERAQKRGRGNVQLESELFQTNNSEAGSFSLDNFIGDEPTPEILVIMEEEHQRLLSLLRDSPLRRIATARIEGYTIPEIASDLSISTRSVERKLKLIRNRWGQELNNVH